jgi:hypothetical protein
MGTQKLTLTSPIMLLPRRCSLLACPRWLELWLGRVRWSSGGVGRVA